jgi:hypothetical protein
VDYQNTTWKLCIVENPMQESHSPHFEYREKLPFAMFCFFLFSVSFYLKVSELFRNEIIISSVLVATFSDVFIFLMIFLLPQQKITKWANKSLGYWGKSLNQPKTSIIFSSPMAALLVPTVRNRLKKTDC